MLGTWFSKNSLSRALPAMAPRKVSSLEAHAIKEMIDRKGLAIDIFRPLPAQDDFFRGPRAKYTLLLGGNRAGKTLSSMVMLAAMLLDKQITLSTGEKVWARTPECRGRKKPFNAWQISIDQRHIGTVIMPLLLKAGAFKVVRDPVTKQLRPYNKDKDDELGLKPQPAPPLIPGRYVHHISWESKADNIMNRMEIKNPATGEIISEINFYTSKGDAPQGKACDAVVIDEQVGRDQEDYVTEMKGRLVDDGGILWWSTWPSDSSSLEAFVELIDGHIAEGNHDIARKVTLTMEGNTTLGKKAVQDFLAGVTDEAERNARNLGIFSKEATRMYPLFHSEIHNATNGDDRMSDVLRGSLTPPADWCRYLALDPGTSNPGVVLLAVPPPEFGDYLVPYQEFYPGRLDPKQLARLIRNETQGQKFWRFIIDKRAGRQQTMGMLAAQTVQLAYEEAFAEVGLRCQTTKSKFVRGSDDVGGRQLQLISLMHENKQGYPTLRMITEKCPILTKQLRGCRKKVVGKDPVDDRKADRPHHDLVDALEYIIATQPKYHFIEPQAEDGTPGFQRYMKMFGGKKAKSPTIQIGTRY